TAELHTHVRYVTGPSFQVTSAALAVQANTSPSTNSAQFGNLIHAFTGIPGYPFLAGKCSKSSSSTVSPIGPARRAYCACSWVACYR
ncbi:hypothetical protein, partial [Arthrobacter sp. ISL-69]|uniref:hypothetical protein n=1 Tax=Arthrobacter sp. ISL-69 TaxID=2819113 RepID=UPI001BEA47E4